MSCIIIFILLNLLLPCRHIKCNQLNINLRFSDPNCSLTVVFWVGPSPLLFLCLCQRHYVFWLSFCQYVPSRFISWKSGILGLNFVGWWYGFVIRFLRFLLWNMNIKYFWIIYAKTQKYKYNVRLVDGATGMAPLPYYSLWQWAHF